MAAGNDGGLAAVSAAHRAVPSWGVTAPCERAEIPTDRSAGLRVTERLEAGMVGLDRGLVSDPAAPFGGVRQSGTERAGGHEGLLDDIERKYVDTSW